MLGAGDEVSAVQAVLLTLQKLMQGPHLLHRPLVLQEVQQQMKTKPAEWGGFQYPRVSP